MNKQTSSSRPKYWLRIVTSIAGAACVWGCGGSDPAPGAADLALGEDASKQAGLDAHVSTAESAGSAAASLSARVLTVNGSGCPQGSAVVGPAQSPNSFSLQFNGYTAALDGDAAVAERRKNCQVMLQVSVPAGYTYAVTSVALKGAANLTPGVTGKAMVSTYFMGASTTATTTQVVPSGAFSTEGMFPPETLAYAPCDAERYLSINTSVALSGQSSSPSVKSTISLDPNATVHLALKKCE